MEILSKLQWNCSELNERPGVLMGLYVCVPFDSVSHSNSPHFRIRIYVSCNGAKRGYLKLLSQLCEWALLV